MILKQQKKKITTKEKEKRKRKRKVIPKISKHTESGSTLREHLPPSLLF
jgi:hypothetical protein